MRAARAWTLHVVLFAVGNLGLLLLWVADAGFPLGWDPAPYWPLWVHALWGAGLVLHGREGKNGRRGTNDVAWDAGDRPCSVAANRT